MNSKSNVTFYYPYWDDLPVEENENKESKEQSPKPPTPLTPNL